MARLGCSGGRSRQRTASALAGCCANGTGAYGITSTGVGAVGRAMGSETVEAAPLEHLLPQVGVFGHSLGGVGVRGHSGPILPVPSPLHERRPRIIGAVSSAGELQDGNIPGTSLHEVALSGLAQMQLIPNLANILPH